MRAIPILTAVTAATLLACTSAQALEPFKLYDDFSTTPLDPARWNDGERIRVIKSGALNLMQRTQGLGGADSGATYVNFNENLSNPTEVTALKAKITVTALEVNACPANPALGQSRVRLLGTFFNISSPVAGSAVGDMLGQLRLTRYSNSADPVGVLQVQGLVSLCTNADCSSNTLVGSVAELGTVDIGVPTTVQMQWDQPAKRFRFSRDSGAVTASVTYTQTDASPPGLPFKDLSTRLDLPTCLSSSRVSGMIDVRLDNISVNSSAAP